MRQIICEKLDQIERQENVRILHAVESGSRAWGFASPDSDYDVRFLYVRPREYYLRLDKQRDVIEWQLDDTLDINGWDLQKALRLLHSSNPTLFEWTNSPIVYRTTPVWENVRVVINQYFSSKSGLYHYLNMANSNYREFLKGETVRLKKYFYVIRPLLACKWILDKHCPPPVLFEELVHAQLDEDLRNIVNELLRRKMASPEMGEGPRIDRLNEYIGRSLVEIKTAADGMKQTFQPGWEPLNRLFLSIVK